jgi:dipeptidyl aminopeptidase/acylaminoacyl peptidase
MRAPCFLVSALAAGVYAAEPVVPLEQFFREPDVRSVQVSPDGRHLTFLTTLATGRVGIALTDVETGKIEPLVTTTDENIGFYHWKGSNYLVYGGDVGGNESTALRGFDLQTRKVVPLAESFRERYANLANFARVIDWLEFDPKHVLVAGRSGTGSYWGGLYLLNVRTGERNRVSDDDEPDLEDAQVDHTGALRVRTRLSGNDELHEVRKDDKSLWFVAGRTPVEDASVQYAARWDSLGFASDNETLYVLTRGETDTGALRTYSVRSRELGPVLFQSSEGEITDLETSYDRTRLYGMRYMTDRPHYHWFDPWREHLQTVIDNSLPGTFNFVSNTSQDEKVLVVVALSDRQAPSYYLLNLRKPEFKLIYMPAGAPLRPVQEVTYTARDGLVIHAYLTLPAGSQGKRVPLILNPHGGPYGIRDEWSYNPEVQFLANRGYAVLQPNFRGSGGYGLKFLKAGQGEWGRKMQDDLTDAVHWAIAQGIADPERVAIYGASYGGYAALAGVTFTPELFRCGVNYVGVSDLAILNRHTFEGARSTRIYFEKWVGNDLKSMHERSPVNFVDRIRVPTLHAYGENDPRVDIDNWKELKGQLDKYQKPYEFIRVDAEGHGFRKEENRLKFYRAMETFFAANLVDYPGKVKVLPTKVIELPAREQK